VRGAIADAGLRIFRLDAVSTRNENRVPVPGLLVIAGR
jgi:predicted TPR repeat methyltransferase